MRGRIKLAAAAVLALVLLAGCNLGAKVVVQPDGSGSYTVVMSVPNAASNPGHSLYTALNSAAATSNVPLTVHPYSSGGTSGASLTYHFLSLADLNAESQRLAASGKGGIGVTVSRDSTGWHFSASTANSLIKPSAAAGSQGSSPALRSLANQVINIYLIVQLPGAPAENNAKTVTHTATSSTFNWVMSSAQTGTVVQASTTFVGNQANVKLASALTSVASSTHSGGSSSLSGSSIGLIAAGAVVVALGAGALIVTRRRRAVPPVEDPVPAD